MSSPVEKLFMLTRVTAEDNKQIDFLDPLSVVYMLCILHWRPPQSRISIKRQHVFIQIPGALQGLTRWWNHDVKEDIAQFGYPLWFWVGLKHQYIEFAALQDKLPEWYSKVNTFLVKGLEKLILTYREQAAAAAMVVQCLEHYTHLLERHFSREEWHANTSAMGRETLFMLYSQFTKLWTIEDIRTLGYLMDRAETHMKDHPDITNQLLRCMYGLVRAKQLEVDLCRPH